MAWVCVGYNGEEFIKANVRNLPVSTTLFIISKLLRKKLISI